MFYEEKDIIEVIRCPYCKNKYNDPRFIECGASFCMPCIELLLKDGENGFKCPECEDFHEQPKKGYSKITNLSKLCEIKAKEVSRGSLVDSLKAQLDEIKLKLNELSNGNNLGVDKIKDYCDKLRNEAQLRTSKSKIWS